ncbi:MAG: ABC transporter permease [Actinobacteria bacterium]|nr:ABC transporter permease [Actinomycetota bacterium]
MVRAAQEKKPEVISEPRRREWFLHAYTKLAIAYLFAPVIFMIVFGFNNPKGRFNLSWEGFTLKYYSPSRLFEFEELNQAITHSLTIAFLTALIATILGTLIALALTRFTFKGRSGLNLFLFLPMASPEVVLGAALLSLFVTLNVARGFTTVLIAHIMFSISYVVVTVKARTAGFDQNLEDAAGDLGASPWVTFWTVTFPLIWPGIMAAALLAFVLSLDDYVITLFNNGGYVTLPLWIAGASRLGVPVQVNVLGTLIFMIGAVYALVSIIRTREGRVRAPVAL